MSAGLKKKRLGWESLYNDFPDLHDTTNELNHTIRNTGQGPNDEDLKQAVSTNLLLNPRERADEIRIPVPIAGAFGTFWLQLASCGNQPVQKIIKQKVKNNKPVAASTIRRMTVMRPNKKMAPARTERVGHCLINGAIRMAPTH